jgi:hypothetical protein
MGVVVTVRPLEDEEPPEKEDLPPVLPDDPPENDGLLPPLEGLLEPPEKEGLLPDDELPPENDGLELDPPEKEGLEDEPPEKDERPEEPPENELRLPEEPPSLPANASPVVVPMHSNAARASAAIRLSIGESFRVVRETPFAHSTYRHSLPAS